MKPMSNKTYVGGRIEKIDSKALLSGKPVYTGDLAPDDCLVVKLLGSPHAHALIESIDTTAAMKVPGIEAIFTYKDVPADKSTN